MVLTSRQSPDRVTLGAFGVLVLIGGVNFVAVRYSNRELAPLFGAGLRFVVAAALLGGFVAMRRIPLPRGRMLRAAVIYGILSFTITYALAYWALQELSAGVGAVVFGATPLITLFLAAAHRVERLSGRGIAGALLTVAGIAVLANPSSDASIPFLPLLAVLGAAVAASEAGVVLKRVPPSHPVATNAVGMAVGAPLLMVMSMASGESWRLPAQASSWLALSYLAVPGSIGLFALFLFVLGRWTASGVSYMTALFPVVATIAGRLIADEPITTTGIVGGAIVIAGVYVGALRGSPAPVSGVAPLSAEAETA